MSRGTEVAVGAGELILSALFVDAVSAVSILSVLTSEVVKDSLLWPAELLLIKFRISSRRRFSREGRHDWHIRHL